MGWDYFAEASAATLQILDLQSQFVDPRWAQGLGVRGLGFRFQDTYFGTGHVQSRHGQT